MVFEIENKVALITGGASGIGLSFAKEILRSGAKGVTIADINIELGKKVEEDLQKVFGLNKCFFINTDVTNYDVFEAAFQKTIAHFGNIDILFNNAGIASDESWKKEILINLEGTIHGMLLGFDKYLPIYKQDKEAVIVNTSSICGVNAFSNVPIYSATKSGIVSLVKSWGIPEFYEEAKVRVVGICPSCTDTALLNDNSKRFIGKRYQRFEEQFLGGMVIQTPDFVAKETMKIIKHAANGTIWVIEDSEPGYEYIFPNKNTMKNNILRVNEY